MSNELDDWQYDDDEAVRFIQNYLPQEMKGKFKDFADFVKEYLIDKEYDQLLLETSSKGSKWIHLGLYNQKGEQRKQIKNLYVK